VSHNLTCIVAVLIARCGNQFAPWSHQRADHRRPLDNRPAAYRSALDRHVSLVQ